MVSRRDKSIASCHILPCLFSSPATKTNISACSISRQVQPPPNVLSSRCSSHYPLGQCTHSILAHLDAVTSVSLDVAGFSLVSGSHDCSVRFWDILGSRACVQEITNHREKAREGVLAVEFHPTLPFMASAGADGAVKLYASS